MIREKVASLAGAATTIGTVTKRIVRRKGLIIDRSLLYRLNVMGRGFSGHRFNLLLVQ